MKISPILCVLALLAAAAAPALASISSDDISFVKSAQHEALGQYALATLARGKAQNAATKALAAKMLSRATKVNDFVKTYADKHAVKIDNKPSLRADEQYGNISAAHGARFDKAFANAVHIDAAIALDAYKDEAQSGTDPALRNFAKGQLAILQQIVESAGKLTQ